jgi:F-type H+-transporting ATPase subunit O
MFAGRVATRTARVAAPRFQLAATRSFAVSAARPADNRPPVELFGVDGTYASALVRLLAMDSDTNTMLT